MSSKKNIMKEIPINYFLTPEAFVSAFGELLHTNEVGASTLINRQMFNLLSEKLQHVPFAFINKESVYRGEIILVGTPNKFKAYYRPVRLQNIINTEQIKQPKNNFIEKAKDITYVSVFLELYNLYKNDPTKEKAFFSEINKIIPVKFSLEQYDEVCNIIPMKSKQRKKVRY